MPRQLFGAILIFTGRECHILNMEDYISLYHVTSLSRQPLAVAVSTEVVDKSIYWSMAYLVQLFCRQLYEDL